MHPALWISKSGLDAQQTSITITSNNLANVNTHGFKKSTAIFKDLMYQKIRQPGGAAPVGSQLPSGLMLGTGVRLSATEKDFKEGSPSRTDRALDLFIDGQGFFQIQRPDGSTAYTRDGKFQLSSTGRVLTSEGLPLVPNVTVPSNALSLSVSGDGVIAVQVPGSTSQTNLGTLQLANFVNPGGLEPIGDNLYIETAASGAPTVGTPAINGIGSVEQGALETSNVNVVEELVLLIQTQRAYEMNAKSVETVDGMMQFVAQVL